ncbi:hypothetical protein HYT24_01740 [Candidatus Pacearchaeota archaeon]|nr:hypothetical protein [Candidatus Pacearchaeota archaeon]
MKRGKQAQGLSVNAIILIVLGVVVLGVMILGFTMGWSNFSSYFSGNNVQSISTACQTACATHSEYDFCTVKRNLKAESSLKDVTCAYLASEQTVYGISSCDILSCDILFSGNVDGSDVCLDKSGKVYQYLEDGTLKTGICA